MRGDNLSDRACRESMFENYLIGLKSDEEAWKERKKEP